MLDLCKEYQVDINQELEVQEVLDAVREIWQKETFKGKNPYYGKIERIQKDTGMGYIHAGGGKGFTLPFRLRNSWLKILICLRVQKYHIMWLIYLTVKRTVI